MRYLLKAGLMPEDFVQGIDTSKWQVKFDWKKAAALGMSFNIVRAGKGNPATGQPDSGVDPTMEINAGATIQNGLSLMFYWRLDHMWSEAANVQADRFVNAVLPWRQVCSQYLMLDCEEIRGPSGQFEGLPQNVVRDWITEFAATVMIDGFRICVYSRQNWWDANVGEGWGVPYGGAFYVVKAPEKMIWFPNIWVSQATKAFEQYHGSNYANANRVQGFPPLPTGWKDPGTGRASVARIPDWWQFTSVGVGQDFGAGSSNIDCNIMLRSSYERLWRQ